MATFFPFNFPGLPLEHVVSASTTAALSCLPSRPAPPPPRLLPTALLALLLQVLLLLPSPGLASPLIYGKIKPKWVNPCGIPSRAMRRSFAQHYEVTPLSDRELLDNVRIAAMNALSHSVVFKEDYVSRYTDEDDPARFW